MPLVQGISRGPWSFSDGGQWAWELELNRPFAELAGSFVDAISDIASVRSVSWGSESEGEDAVVAEATSVGEMDGADVVRLSPVDPAFLVVDMDLFVRFGDATSRTIVNRWTLFAEDELVEGSGSGAYFRFVLHTDIFRPATNGLITDNRQLADHNAPYLARALEAVAAMGARYLPEEASGVRTATGYRPVDFVLPMAKSLATWSTSDGSEEFAPDTRVLQLPLEDDELDQVFSSSQHGVALRDRYTRYVEELRVGWHAHSDTDLAHAGKEALADLHRFGDNFGIVQWQELPEPSAELPVVDLTASTTRGEDLIMSGAGSLRARIEQIVDDSSYSRNYLAAASRVADDALMLSFLVSPLLDEAPPLDGVFRLWICGGSLTARNDTTTVVRMWT